METWYQTILNNGIALVVDGSKYCDYWWRDGSHSSRGYSRSWARNTKISPEEAERFLRSNGFDEDANHLFPKQQSSKDPNLKEFDLEDVEWREYDFGGRVYTIRNPIKFWYRPGGETHRILDKYGVVHLVPAPGINGCAMRYKKTEGANPCKF